MASLNPVLTKFPSVPWFGSSAYVEGFEIEITGATTFTVMPGGARNQTNDFSIQWPTVQPNVPGDITVNIATLGANGCYPLPLSSLGLTADTVFPVYVMGDSAGNQNHNTAVVVATSNDFLLPGYDSFRRIGSVYIASVSSNLIPLNQYGHFGSRRYQLATAVGLLGGGNATTATPLALNNIGLPIPVYATKVTGNASMTASAPNFQLSLTDTATGGQPQITVEPPAIGAIMTVPFELSPALVAGTPTIYYYVTNAADSAALNISGWEEELAINI